MVSGALAEDGAEHSGVSERAIELHEMLGFATFWVFAALVGFRLAIWLRWICEQRTVSRLLGIAGVAVMLVASYYTAGVSYMTMAPA